MGCKVVPLDGSVFALNGVEMGGCWVVEIDNFTQRRNGGGAKSGSKIVQTCLERRADSSICKITNARIVAAFSVKE